MRASSAWAERAVLGAMLLLGVSLTGCKKSVESATAPDDGAMAPTADERGPADPLAELAQLEQRMAALGLERKPTEGGEQAAQEDIGASPTTTAVEPTPAPIEAPRPERDSKRGRQNEAKDKHTEAEAMAGAGGDAFADEHAGVDYCMSVCELSEAICELEVRICAMSQEHGDDPVYTDACERAVDDCGVAGDACNECSDA